jgi:Xaa-Pro aminopeptidase
MPSSGSFEKLRRKSMQTEYQAKVPFDSATRAAWLRLPFPLEEYQDRIHRLRRELDRHQVEAVIVYGRELDPNLRYLANLQSHGGESALVLTAEGAAWCSTTWLLHGEPMHSMVWESWVETFEPATSGAEMLTKAATYLKGAGVRGPVAVIGHASMTAPAWNALCGALGTEPAILDHVMLEVRLRKSPREITYLREACRISGLGIQTALDAVRSGISEREVANRAHAAMFAAGAESLAFGTAVVAGPRAGLKHANPSDRVMQAGEFVFLDMGASYEGYYGDLSRCVIVGDDPDPSHRLLLEHAEDIFHEMVAAMTPGTSVAELSGIYETLAAELGYHDEVMPAAYGHGVGQSLFERPL